MDNLKELHPVAQVTMIVVVGFVAIFLIYCIYKLLND